MKKKMMLLTPMLLGMMLITAFGFPAEKTVTIQTGSESYTLQTRANTVADLLEETALIISETHQITPGLEAPVEEGMTLSLHAAVAVTLQGDGKEEQILTTEKTVKGLLDAAGFPLGPDDQVKPAIMTLLTEGMTIQVTRVEKEYFTEIVEVPYQQLTRFTYDLEPGETRLTQEGSTGRMRIRRAHVTRDGEPEGIQLISTEMVVPPVDEITEEGREKVVMTSDGTLLRYQEVYTMTATAYDAGYKSTGKNPGDPGYGITRSGTRVRPGVVAVDPRVIPLGSTLYVESNGRSASYGISYAEDTGGAIKGNRIDLYYESRQEALRFGRQSVTVYVLEDQEL